MIVRKVFAIIVTLGSIDLSEVTPILHTRAKIQSRSRNWSGHEKRSIVSSTRKNDSHSPLLAEYPLVVLLGHPSQLCEGWRRGSGSEDDVDDNRGYGWWMPRVAERETESRHSRWRVSDISRKWRVIQPASMTRDDDRASPVIIITTHRYYKLRGKITHRTKEDRDVALRALPFARVWILRGVCETARQGGRPLPPQRSTEIAERGRASPNTAARPVFRITSFLSSHISNIYFVRNIWGIII